MNLDIWGVVQGDGSLLDDNEYKWEESAPDYYFLPLCRIYARVKETRGQLVLLRIYDTDDISQYVRKLTDKTYNRVAVEIRETYKGSQWCWINITYISGMGTARYKLLRADICNPEIAEELEHMGCIHPWRPEYAKAIKKALEGIEKI